MSRGWIVTLVGAAFVLGCAASQTVFHVPPARAGTSPQKWEYVCQNDIDDVWEPKGSGITTLNKYGSQGWEIVQQLVGINGANRDVWCFKRALP